MQVAGTTIEEVKSSYEIGAFSSFITIAVNGVYNLEKREGAYQYLRL
jgi:hypothetical protein